MHPTSSGEGALTQHYVQTFGRVNPGHKKKVPENPGLFKLIRVLLNENWLLYTNTSPS